MKKIIFNNKGTLTSTLLGSLMLGGMAVMMMQLSKTGYKVEKSLNISQDIRHLKDQMNISMSRFSCGLASQSISINLDDSSNIPVNSLSLGSTALTTGDYWNKYEVQNIFITAPTDDISLSMGSETTSGGYVKINDQTYLAKLRVQLASKGAVKKTLPIEFNIFVQTNDAGPNISMTDCRTVADISKAKDACQTMSSPDGSLEAVWNEVEGKCEIVVDSDIVNNSSTINNTPASTGFFNFNETSAIYIPDEYIIN